MTGTDTGVGKTIVAAAICAALTARGRRVAAFKPIVTGLSEQRGVWPHDHELLAREASVGQSPNDVAGARFDPPLSPHLAAELAGETIDPANLISSARAAQIGADALICEGVGGLLVPLSATYLVRDLAVELALPLVIVARTSLGTINHTLLTLAAARAVGLQVAAVILTPWPKLPAQLERSNRVTIERLGRVAVVGFPQAEPGSLAAAGATLPLEDWLQGGLPRPFD